MAKESICRNCFHSYVCEQFNENKDDNNEKCHFFNDHYVPTADVIEVVRCKDCRHWYSPTNDDAHYCRIAHGLNGIVAEEDFCSYGRK